MTESKLLNELHRWFCDTKDLPNLPERLQRRIARVENMIDEYLKEQAQTYPDEVANSLTDDAVRAWFSLVILRPERFTDLELAAAEKILTAHQFARETLERALTPTPTTGNPELN